jgi:phospholipid/cholesterol/gamma-HCH transport system substrate-binding protein
MQTPIKHLSSASDALDSATPKLTGATTKLNQLLNAIAYDPPGPEQGDLFYLAWLNHNTNSMFSLQDAFGPMARGTVLQSCFTALNAEALTADPQNAQLLTIQQLTNVAKSAEIC